MYLFVIQQAEDVKQGRPNKCSLARPGRRADLRYRPVETSCCRRTPIKDPHFLAVTTNLNLIRRTIRSLTLLVLKFIRVLEKRTQFSRILS